MTAGLTAVEEGAIRETLDPFLKGVEVGVLCIAIDFASGAIIPGLPKEVGEKIAAAIEARAKVHKAEAEADVGGGFCEMILADRRKAAEKGGNG